MPQDREAGASPPGASATDLPLKLLLPLALLAAAVVAALVARQAPMPAWLTALALLLSTAGALVSGAYWSRQRQAERLREARQHQNLLGQLMPCWQWQTDAEHRLIRFQPPQGAPSSAWVGGAAVGVLAWERFDDAGQSLRERMNARVGLQGLRVRQIEGAALGQAGGPASATGGRSWRLSGLPRLDSRGRFAGYLGVAEPTAEEDAQHACKDLLLQMLGQGPVALAWVVPVPSPRPGDATADPSGGSAPWRVQHASPAAAALLGVDADGPADLPWSRALERLPPGLRDGLALPRAGTRCDADGWQARWFALAAWPAPGAPPPDGGVAGLDGDGLLLALNRSAPAADDATQALAAEYAAFSYTISHDLRAPIRVVEGFGRILKEDHSAQLDRIGRDHLDRMISAATRMNHMIDALLSLSQLSTQPLARQPVNLSQLAGWVVEDLRRAQPERKVAVHIAPQLSTTGDPTLLRTVLENLLGNAWKYSGKNAAAEIRFERVEQAGRPVYCVADNGAGFDMRFADRLFGVFQRLHSASDFQGNGVGLASVRRIVRRHGGDIWAESAVGQGARFYFTLAG